jgi:kumamolisin
MTKRPLQGSERAPLQGARSVGKADPNERFEVSVLVRRQAGQDFQAQLARAVAPDGSEAHITRDDFAKEFGASPSDINAVKKFANDHGLAVVQEDAARRTLVLSGTVEQFNSAFGVDLQQFEHDGGTYRGRTGAVQLPEELSGIVQAVVGLDNRPQARSHFRTRETNGNVRWHAAADTSRSFTPVELATLYGFPGGTGHGVCIGIIELGGGYRPADLTAYFSGLGIPSPNVSAVSVDHGTNHATGDGNGPDGEVMLDIEVAGAIAPGANIVVYFAPNTDAGFLDAITTAVHDRTNAPSIISISWGQPESAWTQQSMTAFDQAFQEAVALGVTICVASGDDGSSDGVKDGADHVDFPASSPHVLACGGTNVQATNGQIGNESVWNDGANGGAGGGGVSVFFARPAWQDGLTVTSTKGSKGPLQMRGVPDVCGDADPQSGYDVRVDGNDTVIGGTSAVAPLWSGLIARLNSTKGSPMGYINPLLYKNPNALRDITQGNNGSFSAAPGWDACTGLGSPNGRALSILSGNPSVPAASA